MADKDSKTTIVRVEQVVDYFAESKRRKDPSLTQAQARAEVWRERPSLALAWRLANHK